MIHELPREGDIFDIVSVGGHHFTIRYGYYDEAERNTAEPIPIYPCFLTEPRYTPDGMPLVTRVQDACEHYCPENAREGDGWCADCIHCLSEETHIGICQCSHRQKPNQAVEAISAGIPAMEL